MTEEKMRWTLLIDSLPQHALYSTRIFEGTLYRSVEWEPECGTTVSLVFVPLRDLPQ